MSIAKFEIAKLIENRGAFDNEGWQEFFANSSLRVGIYELPARGEDTQEPHEQDEIYYVLSGEGTFVSGNAGTEERLPVKPGTVLFVAQHTKHRFENFPQGLTLLVLFSGS